MNLLKNKPTLPGILVFLVPLAAYATTMPTSITLEDAGLFQMVCTQGGLSHPPGYPFFTLLCQNLMISDHIFAGNLLSGVFGALCLLAFHMLLSQWLTPLSAMTATLAYGFSLTFWQQSLIIEVYTLAALLFYLTWFLLDRFIRTRDWRAWFSACLVFGLALSNHWPLMLLGTPALAAAAWPIMREQFSDLLRPKTLSVSVLCLIAGLTPYISLWTAESDEFGVFGAVTTFDGFVDYITRALYDDQHAGATWDDKLHYLGWLVPEAIKQFGIPASIASLAGFGLMVRNRHPLMLPSLLNFLGATAGLVLLLGFEFDAQGQSIFRPYPIIAWGSIAIWLGYFLNWMGHRLKNRYAHIAILVTFVAVTGISNLTQNNRSHEYWVENYFTSLLEGLPEGAVLFADGDLLSFPLGYLHFVQGKRPDVTLLNWSSLTYPNRLSPATASRAEKEARIIHFVNGTSQPVFVIEATLAPLTRHGWFNEINRGDRAVSIITTPAEQAMDEVLVRYQSGYLKHQQELELADFILASFTRMYILHQQSGAMLDTDQLNRFQMLLATFPGKMILLEHELTKEQAPDRRFLTEVYNDALDQLPGYLTRKNLLRLYGYGERIELLPQKVTEE